MIDQKEYAQRRSQLFAQMLDNSIAIVPTAPEHWHSTDEFLDYRPDYNFYYLTGFTEPEAIAVFIKSEGHEQFILFNRPRDEKKEQWLGARAGQLKAVSDYHADEAYGIDEFAGQISILLTNKKSMYYPLGRYADVEALINDALKKLRFRVRSGVRVPDTVMDINQILFAMRLIKTPAEIEVMQKAADISVDAHIRAMQTCRPGMFEYEIEAELHYEFRRRGASGYAYPSIVAGGKNACILHYVENDQKLRDGDLLLIDAGAKYQGYNADITRTFPVNGTFSGRQKVLYEVVLNAQLAVIEAVKPGNSWAQMNEIAERKLTEGALDIGLLKGSVDQIIEEKAFRSVYMHHVAHWLGLDVHDVGAYKTDDQWQTLQPGMVTTVEPGLYVKPGLENVDEAWWGMGVRIEDNICVTDNGHEILTAKAPKTVKDIEAAMRL